MARRPDFSKREESWSQDDLKKMQDRLALLSRQAVEAAYDRAFESCRLIYSRIPSARNIQELVQIWKSLRKWR